MQSEDKIRILHILDEAKEALQYAHDILFDEFLKMEIPCEKTT